MTDILNRIAAIPAQITRLSNLFNITNPSSPSHFHSITDTDTDTDSSTRAHWRARLCRNPKSLYFLWNEYKLEVSGSRPAKTFSRNERGIDRFTFYRNNIFSGWIVQVMKRGRSANELIDKIYQVYGYKISVTNIIKKLQEGKKKNFNKFL